MKRVIIGIVVGIILVAAGILWLVPWVQNGGLPSSGPVGGIYPPNIMKVSPLDGQSLAAEHGFCVFFNYYAGNGMVEFGDKDIRYFLDGREVSSHVYDAVDLEYPIGTGEPCYKGIERLNPGWHTAKVTYRDHDGIPYEYKWRFEVLGEE